MTSSRADGRADDAARPIKLDPPLAGPSRRVRCWSSSAAPGCCAPPPPHRAGARAGSRARAAAGSPPNTPCRPRATNTRSDRESVKGQIGGRTRRDLLADRPLAALDHRHQGPRRNHHRAGLRRPAGRRRNPHPAAITGAYVALAEAVAHLRNEGALKGDPLTGSVAAVSVGHHRRRPAGLSLGLVPRTHPSAGSGVCWTLDPRNKCGDDRCDCNKGLDVPR